MSVVQHPCRVCPQDQFCSVGRRAHCGRFVRYTQVLLRLRQHQRLVRDLARLVVFRQG